VHSYPALIFEKHSKKYLIITDLHIGWESALAEQGIHIPSQTPKLIENFKKLIEHTKPDHLFIIGDVKHSIKKVELSEWQEIPLFLDTALDLVNNISIVLGNHDGNIEALVPKDVEILPASGFKIDNEVGMIHGHAWPKPEILSCKNIVMGHLHPIITIKDRLGFSKSYRVWLRTKSDGRSLAQGILNNMKIKLTRNNVDKIMKQKFNVILQNPDLIFMPSFNDILTGRTINKKLTSDKVGKSYIGPIIKSGSVHLEEGEIYLLDGSHLGKLGSLRSFS
jgi:putative SbcD/Mre11-related phosphoesterase